MDNGDDEQTFSRQDPSLKGRCKAWCQKSGILQEIKGNAVKAMLILATIITSTYTAYTINNLQMKLELAEMRLQSSRTPVFAAVFDSVFVQKCRIK